MSELRGEEERGEEGTFTRRPACKSRAWREHAPSDDNGGGRGKREGAWWWWHGEERKGDLLHPS